jgi:hypothetical protein
MAAATAALLPSRAGQWQNFQPEFFRNLHPARDVLLLLRSLQTATAAPISSKNLEMPVTSPEKKLKLPCSNEKPRSTN